MALIKCPSCGEEISDKARRCPHCGTTELTPLPFQPVNVQKEPDEIKQEPTTVAPEQTYADTRPVEIPQTKQTDKKDGKGWLVVLLVSIVLILIGGCVGGWFYYQNVYLPEKIDREAPRTHPMVNVFIRSSKMSGGDFNKVGRAIYGSELITYENDGEWSRVKLIPTDPTLPTLEGYVASAYLLTPDDFKLLHGIFGNEEAAQVLETSKVRRALLDYYKTHKYVGAIASGDSISGITPSAHNQWQIFLSSATEKPNEVYFARALNRESKFTDMAVILRNVADSSLGKLLYFKFDDDETPHLVFEYDVTGTDKINGVKYQQDGNGGLEITTTNHVFRNCETPSPYEVTEAESVDAWD